MQTIGQLLADLRKEKKLSLDDIAKKTKIAKHLLQSLEKDDYKNLPSSTFTKGFITNYARVVGLSSHKALAVFRRDFVVSQSGKIMPKGLAKPLDKKTYVASKILIIIGTVFLISIFLAYLFWQLKNYNAPPTLDITRPRAKAIVKGPIVSVKGFGSLDSTIYVNGKIAEVYPTGEFFITVQLPAGEQNIEVKAVNHKNKNTIKNIPVTVVDK